ncbi:pirin family protein [Streptomyces sp. NRRL F-2890]|uniref:pirin family protein n=1 Tax=Streptomyces sp. NRRL F-2890 TaxID=1463845 RepID=UPI0004CC21D3|nr:pirin family protein [Streptomyces sp. NRRL F-2890]
MGDERVRVQRGADRHRGGEPGEGIDSRYAFSFGGHYDPDNVRFGPLLACNEERLAPGSGFGEHPHRDVELVSWVLAGTLTHQDAAGRTVTLGPGDLQHQSAGAGIRHTERNAGPEPLRFLQMWLEPGTAGGEPRYTVLRSVPLDEPYEVPGAGARLRVCRPAAGAGLALPPAPRVYLVVTAGSVRLGDTVCEASDAARITDAAGLTAEAGPAGAEVLIWEFDGGHGAP